ncbi:SDR family oxidoreductase [Burkholderia sp. Ac-20349]|uniref:SDR family NAD(P)-dependent oxidoreductase n=1 Tax=Burkholderia sp. Ac-20349 TaxID=2703893 RepID=UPI00197C5E81|nr:SDR family oxidoreductase [Burkholderia sp. Ac-20349]MBN3838773.1 SDR family oxidoreductase [Burkholderia sp. Ac-20349]
MRRVALITGAGGGIGRAIALELASRGLDIAVVDQNVESLLELQKMVLSCGVQCSEFVADVADFSTASRIATEVMATRKRIDVLVNNAGASAPKGIVEISEAEFDRSIAVNLKSCFNYAHAVAPHMLADAEGGRIINISSVSASSGGVTSAVSKHAYATAKAGILGLTRSLAKELGPTVLVNAISPGVIATEYVSEKLGPRVSELTAGIALRRLGIPEDIASFAAYLACEKNVYMTGQNVTIDGFQWSC